MANVAKNAILRAKLEGVLTDIMVKTVVGNVYVDETTTLETKLATLAAQADVTALQQTIDALGALAQKDKVSYADLEEALAALIDGKAEASALTEEIARAKAAEEANAAAIETEKGRVDTLVGTDTGKSVRAIANEELAAQLIGENAKESLDTLAEIAAWIQSHPDDASAMNEAITALQAKVDTGDQTVTAYVTAAIEALKIGDYAKAADLTALAERVEANETDIASLKETAAGLGAMATKDNVTESDLDAALAEKVNAAAEGNHSHSNKDELDKIAEGDKAKWDAAAEKAHEHANKDVIDGITADLVSAWNGKANIYYSATEPANMTEVDLWVQLID